MSKVLLIEDDEILSGVLTRYLERQNYVVENAGDGEQAWKRMTTKEYDLILLDIGLPKIDGFQLLKNFRSENNSTPIIIITSYSSDSNELESYKHGSNIFHRKPINPRLLLHQIHSIHGFRSSDKKQLGEYHIHPEELRLSYGSNDNFVQLTPSESIILGMLFISGSKPIDKHEFAERLAEEGEFSDPTNIEPAISRLRKKLRERFGDPSLIQTVRKKGYRLNPTLNKAS